MHEKNIDFSAMIAIILRRWRVPASLCVLTAVVAALLNFLVLPRWYESTTILMPPQEKSGFGLMGMLLSRVTDMPGGLSRLASGIAGVNPSQFLFVVILNSQTVSDSLIDKYDLMRVYKSKYRFLARKELQNRTSIDFPPEGHIVIKVEAKEDPQLAMDLANEYVTQLNNVILDRGLFAATKRRRFLEDRVGQARETLAALEDSLLVLQKKYGIVEPTEQAKGLAELVAAPLRGNIELLALLQAERESKSIQLRLKEEFYTARHSEVRFLKSEVDELDRSIHRIRDELTAVTRMTGNEMVIPVSEIPEVALEYTRLYRSARIQEEMFALLTAQYEEARINEADDIPSAIVLDRATLPEYKSRPKRLLNIAISTAAALILSLIYIMAAARLRVLREE